MIGTKMLTGMMLLLRLLEFVTLFCPGNSFQRAIDVSGIVARQVRRLGSVVVIPPTLLACVHEDYCSDDSMSVDNNNNNHDYHQTLHRRTLLQAAAMAVTTASLFPTPPVRVAAAAAAAAQDGDDDLTLQMFNADGSLKDENMEIEAKFRTVTMSIDSSSAERVVCLDGGGPLSSSSSCRDGPVQVSYSLPLKWQDDKGAENNSLYLDRSNGINAQACNRITVYQAPGKVPVSQLEKATRTGIAKALEVTPELGFLDDIQMADLIGGRTNTRDNGQKYFQFDLGVAPQTCASDAPDNLGLGFCPFESLYLLSGTVLNDRLYVFALQCNKEQWKRANADLRRVRSTFTVTA